MPKFAQDFLDRVLGETDIVSVITPYTTLKKSGSRYLGLCPFHTEKTPSFSVQQEKGFYHCFGCGVSGDAIGFIRAINNYSFIEAVEKLAASAGIPIIYEENPENAVFAKQKRLQDMNRQAAKYFVACGLESRAAKEYLKKRGLSEETIRRHGIGYAPSGSVLAEFLASKGYTDEEMIETGLIRVSENGRKWSYFYNRIMFPIFNVSGYIVGFGGRVMGDAQPKYLNSPESSVFSKGTILYNLNEAKKHFKEMPIILVEGYMDVIGLCNKGILTAAASLGTSLTESHAKLIKQYTDDIIVCYDGDAAGIKAAVRASDILLAAGLLPRVLQLEGGEDPDSFVARFGRDAFIEKLQEAADMITFKLSLIEQEFKPDDIRSKRRYIEKASAIIAASPDGVTHEHFGRILSEKTSTDYSIIREGIARASADIARQADLTQQRKSREYRQQEEQPRSSKVEKESRTELQKASGETPMQASSHPEIQRNLLRFVLLNEENWKLLSQMEELKQLKELLPPVSGYSFLFADENLRECYECAEDVRARQKVLDFDKSPLYNNTIARTLSLLDDLEESDGGVPNQTDAILNMKTLLKAFCNDYLDQLKEQLPDAGEAIGAILAKRDKVKKIQLSLNRQTSGLK